MHSSDYSWTVPADCNSARSDPLASHHSTTHPSLTANPKATDLFCWLFLPILFCPPEAAHLGDLLWLWVQTDKKINPSLRFSRTFNSVLDTTSVALYQPLNHILWQSDSIVSCHSQGTRTPPSILADISQFSCVTANMYQKAQISMFQFRNINLILIW